MRRFAAALFVLSALAVTAGGGVSVQLGNGNSASGTLEPVDEVEVFVVRVPAGATLKAKAKGAKRGPVVGLRVRDDLGAEVTSGKIVEKKTGASAKLLLERGGAYSVEVFSRDLGATGEYSLKVSWKSPKKYTEAPPAAAEDGSVAFRADRGATINASVAAAKGSDVVPRLTRITGPNDFEVSFDDPGKAASDKVKKVEVTFTGPHTLHYANDGAAGGGVKAKVTVKQPKPVKAVFDVTNAGIDVEGGKEGTAVGLLALPDEETSLIVGPPADGNDPLAAITGAGILVPAGAIRKPAAIVVGVAETIDPPQDDPDTELGAAGPAVFFGPEGQTFDPPATVTIPASVVADQENVVVVTVSNGETTTIDSGVVVSAGSVSFPASGFSSFQAFVAAPRPTETKLTVAGLTTDDFFGEVAALDNDTAVISAFAENDEGAVYVFTRDGAGVWTQQARLTVPFTGDPPALGLSVDVHGDTLAAGAANDEVSVFTRDGAGAWTLQDTLTASDGAMDDSFGATSVAVHGDTVVVAATGDDDGGAESGSAYVFTRDGGGVWTEQAKLTATGAAAGDLFGISVALNGDSAAIGAAGVAGAGLATGAVFVFTRDGGGVWTEQQKLTASDTAAFASLGRSVGIAGDTIVAGFDARGFAPGQAYVFTRDTGVWTESVVLTASDTANGDGFAGAAVAIDGERIVVGARRGGLLVPPTGAAYVFERTSPGVWPQIARLAASDGLRDDQFGFNVDLTGDTILVAASGGGFGPGVGYVFDIEP